MPSSLEKRLEALERGGGRKGRVLVWREGEPELRPKRGQVAIRVYRSYMATDGQLMTPAEVAVIELRLVEIEEQRLRWAAEAEEAAAARAARLQSDLEARRARATVADAGATDAAPPPSHHSADQADQAGEGRGYTAEELAARGWTLDPLRGLTMNLGGRRR